jgi:hypothetical protein
MYKLKVPVENINFEQWKEIFHALRYGDYFGYIIAENDEYFLTEEFNGDIMGLLSLVSNSPNYDVKDTYILYDKHHNLLISGDEKLILSVLSIHFRTALTIFMRELDSGNLELSERLEGVFEEYE